MGHVATGTSPPFTMLDFNFQAMGGASFELHNSGLPQVRKKMPAQHAGGIVGE
jgi:hypothetical protein